MQAIFSSRGYHADMSKRSDPEYGRYLRSLREAAGISQREVARQLGVHHSNVGFWERSGTVPRSNLLPKLASILGIPVESIIGDSDTSKKNQLPASRLGKAFESVANLPRHKQKRIVEVVEALVSQEAKAS